MRRTIANLARAGTALAAAGLIVGTAPALGGGAATSELQPLTPMSGGAVLAAVARGQALDRVRVTSPIVVTTPFAATAFECTGCLFEMGRRGSPFAGVSLSIENGSFGRVDLRGAEFKGRVDLAGATFQGPALFDGSTTVSTTFHAKADFSLATFSDVAGFASVTFSKEADFSQARFRDEADFGSTTFSARAGFDSARFAKQASFLSVDFQHLDFNYVLSSGSVDFGFATFHYTGPPDAEFTYSGFNDISFDQADFKNGVQLSMTSLQAHDLVFAPIEINHVKQKDRAHVLGLIEASAKSTNDLGVANEAHYRLLALRSQSYSPPVHFLDFVFYRSIAGYLVEPFQPLLTLLGLALLVSLLRLCLPPSRRARLRLRMKVAWRERSAPGPHLSAHKQVGSRPRPPVASRFTPRKAGAWETFGRYGHELLDTLALMWPGSSAASAGRRFEANVYRVLFVCMLIGFANSNPTLRQMLDALH